MKFVLLALAVFAFLAGLRSAWLWYRASRVQIIPMWEQNGRIEPVDVRASQQEWIIALLQTAQKSGDLNRRAALWTAATALLSAISALVSIALA